MNMNWLICEHYNLKCFMENPPINEKIKSLHYPHRQTGLSPKGPSMKMGNELYKIIKLHFFLKVIVQIFHDKNNEGIAHLVYSKCNPFVMDGGIVCNMA